MEGFVKLDKPKGITSFGVIARLRKLTGVKKIGHAGTLDPMATGLMIVAIGKNYTKQLGQFLGMEKTYEGEITFGSETDTYDAEGQVVNTADASQLNASKIKEAMKPFVGDIMQVPPAFSAKKIKGKKAYELARKGKDVSLEPAKKTVFSFEVLDIHLGENPTLCFSVHCSSGTYVRSLAHDLGKSLGVGAHLSALRRTKIGEMGLDGALCLEGLELKEIERVIQSQGEF